MFCIVVFGLYRPEYLINHLWHDCVAVGSEAFFPPLRKGNAVQQGGKPIMSATYRGLSWEGCPSVGWEAIILAMASSKLPLSRPARLLLFKSNPFTLLLRGVGSRSCLYAAMLERLGMQSSERSTIRFTNLAGSSVISFALGVGSSPLAGTSRSRAE